MGIFAALEKAARLQWEKGDLPWWLYEPILEVTRNPERFAEDDYLLGILLMQLEEFELYADSGCCKTGFDDKDIKMTLRKLGLEPKF